MQKTFPSFNQQKLDAEHGLWLGRLPDELVPNVQIFETLWQLHPEKFHEIKIYGRLVKTPRWQQAYGHDYRFTGQVNKAMPVLPTLEPFLRWSREKIDLNLNGLLLNWYDGALGHYIGAHHDSTINLVPGSPIVTISLGDERIFRLRRPRCTPIDIPVRNGDIIILPWKTNLVFTHEVLRSKRDQGRRISVTLRRFMDFKE